MFIAMFTVTFTNLAHGLHVRHTCEGQKDIYDIYVFLFLPRLFALHVPAMTLYELDLIFFLCQKNYNWHQRINHI